MDPLKGENLQTALNNIYAGSDDPWRLKTDPETYKYFKAERRPPRHDAFIGSARTGKPLNEVDLVFRPPPNVELDPPGQETATPPWFKVRKFKHENEDIYVQLPEMKVLSLPSVDDELAEIILTGITSGNRTARQSAKGCGDIKESSENQRAG
ncbi:hypothetical protein MMC29_001197 [Sticta canariensis]|nr:hypothetical protein [Sticta canariensis]